MPDLSGQVRRPDQTRRPPARGIPHFDRPSL